MDNVIVYNDVKKHTILLEVFRQKKRCMLYLKMIYQIPIMRKKKRMIKMRIKVGVIFGEKV